MEFPINEELVSETKHLKEERRLIQERIEKIEAARSEVSDRVYQRVRTDYDTKLSAASQALLAQKDAIDRELATLYEARKKVSANVDEHKEQLEELTFRQTLGEFEEEEFKKQSKELSAKLKKFEKLLAAINHNVSEYEGLFSDEADLVPAGPEAAKPPKPPAEASIQDVMPETTEPPLKGEDYNIEQAGGDYFAPEAEGLDETRVFHPEDLDADTMIGPEPTPTVGPMLAIVEGSDVGAVYPLEGQITIGRGKANAIVIHESKVSRKHADIHRKGKKWIISDLQSSNGVFVNGARITETTLQSGDHVQIGDTVLEFRLEG